MLSYQRILQSSPATTRTVKTDLSEYIPVSDIVRSHADQAKGKDKMSNDFVCEICGKPTRSGHFLRDHKKEKTYTVCGDCHDADYALTDLAEARRWARRYKKLVDLFTSMFFVNR